MNFMPYFWIAVILLSVATESLTAALVAIWFMPSALVSMILAFFHIDAGGIDGIDRIAIFGSCYAVGE